MISLMTMITLITLMAMIRLMTMITLMILMTPRTEPDGESNPGEPSVKREFSSDGLLEGQVFVIVCVLFLIVGVLFLIVVVMIIMVFWKGKFSS